MKTDILNTTLFEDFNPKTQIKQRIESLRAELERHTKLYYVDAAPEISDKEFGVQLTFDGRPFFIRVPFSALVEFKDPSVDFMLSFQPKPQNAAADNDMELPLDEKPDTVPDPGRVVSLDEFRKNRK